MELVFRNIHVIGSLLSTKAEADEMLQVVAEHGIQVRKNVVRGLDKVPEVMKLVESGKMSGKGVVVIHEGDVGRQGMEGEAGKMV